MALKKRIKKYTKPGKAPRRAAKKSTGGSKGAARKHRSILESSKAIEVSYEKERNRIEEAAKHLEQQRLENYIKLLQHKKELVAFKREKLKQLERNVTGHANGLKRNIDKLRGDKKTEKFHFDRLYYLNEHLKRIESQVKSITHSRKTLLDKEKSLLSDIKKFIIENKGEIEHHGINKLRKIKGVLTKKERILHETALILGRDVNTLTQDKRLLEKITDKQVDKVNEINQELRKISEQHHALLKRKQQLNAEDFEYKQTLGELENKRKQFVEKLRKVMKSH